MTACPRREFLKILVLTCPVLALGQSVQRQKQQKPKEKGVAVLKDECIGCEMCIDFCPVAAIEMKDALPVIDNGTCDECGECVAHCPAEALVFKRDLPEARGEARNAPEAVRKEGGRPFFTGAFDVMGLWVFTSSFLDGMPPVTGTLRFVGTASSGAIKTPGSEEDQGTYKFGDGKITFQLPNGWTVQGYVVSTSAMEGTLPEGRGLWRAERKRGPDVRST